MVVAELQGLPDVLQTRLVFLQLVVDCSDQIVNQTVLLVGHQNMPKQLLRGEQDLHIVTCTI